MPPQPFPWKYSSPPTRKPSEVASWARSMPQIETPMTRWCTLWWQKCPRRGSSLLGLRMERSLLGTSFPTATISWTWQSVMGHSQPPPASTSTCGASHRRPWTRQWCYTSVTSPLRSLWGTIGATCRDSWETSLSPAAKTSTWPAYSLQLPLMEWTCSWLLESHTVPCMNLGSSQIRSLCQLGRWTNSLGSGWRKQFMCHVTGQTAPIVSARKPFSWIQAWCQLTALPDSVSSPHGTAWSKSVLAMVSNPSW